jgi:hypothetical protein
MMFKCLEVHVKSSPGVSRGIARLVMFLNMEIQFLILPAIGYFVMWYFGWLPMPAWVKWVYVIYGTIFLVGTYGFFINTKNERSL